MSNFIGRLTAMFDNITDLFGRKEERDGLVFEALKNSMANPYGKAIWPRPRLPPRPRPLFAIQP